MIYLKASAERKVRERRVNGATLGYHLPGKKRAWSCHFCWRLVFVELTLFSWDHLTKHGYSHVLDILVQFRCMAVFSTTMTSDISFQHTGFYDVNRDSGNCFLLVQTLPYLDKKWHYMLVLFNNDYIPQHLTIALFVRWPFTNLACDHLSK